jgi:hypothetical protein
MPEPEQQLARILAFAGAIDGPPAAWSEEVDAVLYGARRQRSSMRFALLDAGPIIGLLYRGDRHRHGTVQALGESARLGRRICTTWEAISEAYTFVITVV